VAKPGQYGFGVFGGRGGPRVRRAAAEVEEARTETIERASGELEDQLLASTADPGEAKIWKEQFDGFKELALSQDEAQQRAGLTGLAQMGADVRAAVDRRQEAQAGFIVEQARELREQHLAATKPMRELQANAETFDSLLKDPDFNQNLALNRGYLMTLVGGTARQMLSDPADMADALMMSGGGGLIGSLVKLAGGALDAEDFKFTKEDYGAIMRAAYTFNEKKYRATVAPIELEAAALDQAAAGLDFLPQGYSLTQFVTNGPADFANPMADEYDTTKPPSLPAPLETALTALGDALGTAESGGDPNRAAEGPEFGSVGRQDTGILERVTGVFDIANEINAQISEAMSAGATVRADPQTGALFAIYDDGRREEVETSTVKRSYVLNALRAGRTGRQRPRSGVIDRTGVGEPP
jgi:hypothetical protein